MVIIAPILAFLGQQIGRVAQMAFGWATVMLFGRVPQSKSLLLAGVAIGAIAWMVALVGILIPAVGAFLLALAPIPSWLDPGWVRLAMLVLAASLPLLVGLGGYFLIDKPQRPRGTGIAIQLLRGYPYAALLALVLLLLIVVAPIGKVRSIVKRWEDAHIPIMVKPGGYDQVAADIESAVDQAGLDVQRTKAPPILELPSKFLALVGGASVRRLVPDRLIALKADDLEVIIHPSDISMAGRKAPVARARAAIASRITFTAAYLTSSEESQRLEDWLAEIASSPSAMAWQALALFDEQLATLTIAHDEWEVLYRQRLQIERRIARSSTDKEADGDGLIGVVRQLFRALVP